MAERTPPILIELAVGRNELPEKDRAFCPCACISEVALRLGALGIQARAVPFFNCLPTAPPLPPHHSLTFGSRGRARSCSRQFQPIALPLGTNTFQGREAHDTQTH